MDYEENEHGKEISKTGFVMIIVLCLLAIGAISYFTLSGMKTKVKDNADSKSKDKTYSEDNYSYNSDVTEPQPDVSTPSESVDKNESDVPYDDTASAAKSEKINFSMPIKGNVAKGYSETELQYSATYGDMRIHTGIDILCATGTDVLSAANGTVISIEDSATLGKVITVDHSGGITVKYASFETLNVKQGDSVKRGDVLGTSGTVPSEANDQPHIHIELYENGELASPLDVMRLK